MKLKKYSLSKQLLIVVGISFFLLFVSLIVLLPRIIMPVIESTIYSHLKEPLEIYSTEIDNNIISTETAYLYITNDTIMASANINEVVNYKDMNNLVRLMNKEYGKLIINHRTYYYYTLKNDNIKKIAITNNKYIETTKRDLLNALLPLILGVLLLTGLLIVLWSSFIVRKIEILKNKIDNIDNSDYNHKIDFKFDDEIRSLALALEDMRISLVNQEEYRNQMYQNISHDFKTPLTVIKSYIEASEDGIEEPTTALKTIKEEALILERKVHSLLYLNKLDYLKNIKNIPKELINMEEIIKLEVEKFKFHRKEIKFEINCDKKARFYGSKDSWETILDNILSNFMRYTNENIKITLKQNKLILYNDGDAIDKDFLEVIFTPFRKGIKGEFGLGLSIVKKTLEMMGYDINIKNEKKGVSFIITEKKGISR